MQQTFESNAAAPAKARRAVESFLDEPPSPPSGGSSPEGQSFAGRAIHARDRRKVLLVVSELVTNAVQHGGPPIQLKLVRTGECVLVEVSDSGPGIQLSLTPPEDPSRGHGLLIVERISDRWGTRSHRVGKTIWCDVSISSAESPAESLRRHSDNRDEDASHG